LAYCKSKRGSYRAIHCSIENVDKSGIQLSNLSFSCRRRSRVSLLAS
jgi:hypothetical protein